MGIDKLTLVTLKQGRMSGDRVSIEITPACKVIFATIGAWIYIEFLMVRALVSYAFLDGV